MACASAFPLMPKYEDRLRGGLKREVEGGENLCGCLMLTVPLPKTHETKLACTKDGSVQ